MLSSQPGHWGLSHAPADVCPRARFQSSCGDSSNTMSENFVWSLLRSPLCMYVFHPPFVMSLCDLRPSVGGCDLIWALSVCYYGKKGTYKRHSCIHRALRIPTVPSRRAPVAWPLACNKAEGSVQPCFVFAVRGSQ